LKVCEFFLLISLLQAGPQPKFKAQEQDSPGYEYKMDPIPDYGLDSYKGSGKLQDKVAVITGKNNHVSSKRKMIVTKVVILVLDELLL
jgi:hypothetical protein